MPNPNAARATIVVDLDGTLADARHRLWMIRNTPPDWERFFKAAARDGVFRAVWWVVQQAFYYGDRVILLTGRPERNRQITEDWLRRHNVRYDLLFMRGDDDRREDRIFKLEVYRRLIEAGHDVRFVIEDRPSVVRMWRENDVPCFAVDDREWSTDQHHYDGCED